MRYKKKEDYFMNNYVVNHLWWENKDSKVRTHAGVAFYNERFGEYRLKLDVLGNERQLYCKIIGSADGFIRYRMELVKRKDGIFWRRQRVGEGYSNIKEVGADVYIEIPPYDAGHFLVMTIDGEKDEQE